MLGAFRDQEDELDKEIPDRLFVDIFNRFLHLVLLARIGNGTWHDGDALSSFDIEWAADDESDIRVRVNDENTFWSHPRAARSWGPGTTTIGPTDLFVEPLPLPDHPADRFIRGVWNGERWEIEIRLNRPHPRRAEHIRAARDFVKAADLLLVQGHLRAFYESAFHAAEHLAQAELLSYTPTAELILTSKTHQTVRSTYALWARLGNTSDRFARLLTTLEQDRQANTYLRVGTESGPADAEEQLAVLHEMLDWVIEMVEEEGGPKVVHLVATREIAAGELVGTEDLALHAGNRRRNG